MQCPEISWHLLNAQFKSIFNEYYKSLIKRNFINNEINRLTKRIIQLTRNFIA